MRMVRLILQVIVAFCREETIMARAYILKEKFLDEVAVSNLRMILEICHGSSHAKSTNDNTVRKDVNKYLAITGTKNLLHACTLMLADIILMYCHNIIKHSAEIQSGTSFWSLKMKCVQNVQRYIGTSPYLCIRKRNY